MNSRPYHSELMVSFSSNKDATVVMQSLEGDDELQPNKIDKTFHVENSKLIMYVFIASLFQYLLLLFISFIPIMISSIYFVS